HEKLTEQLVHVYGIRYTDAGKH
ncbi:unnamed protein product, partial [Allacma fusca]